MKRLIFLLTCVVVTLNIFADYSNVATGNDYHLRVLDHVSVLTGQFVNQRNDLLLPAKEPIFFNSTFPSYLEGINNTNTMKIMPHLYAEHESYK